MGKLSFALWFSILNFIRAVESSKTATSLKTGKVKDIEEHEEKAKDTFLKKSNNGKGNLELKNHSGSKVVAKLISALSENDFEINLL